LSYGGTSSSGGLINLQNLPVYLNNVIIERPGYSAIYGAVYIQDFR